MSNEVTLTEYASEWLDAYMELHHIKTKSEAIADLIETYKAWNIEMMKPTVVMKKKDV